MTGTPRALEQKMPQSTQQYHLECQLYKRLSMNLSGNQYLVTNLEIALEQNIIRRLIYIHLQIKVFIRIIMNISLSLSLTTYSAIFALTLEANNAAFFFSSSDGVYTGKNYQEQKHILSKL